jgi:hypothetical protein
VALLIAAHEVGVDNWVEIVPLPSFLLLGTWTWHYNIMLEIEMGV